MSKGFAKIGLPPTHQGAKIHHYECSPISSNKNMQKQIRTTNAERQPQGQRTRICKKDCELAPTATNRPRQAREPFANSRQLRALGAAAPNTTASYKQVTSKLPERGYFRAARRPTSSFTRREFFLGGLGGIAARAIRALPAIVAASLRLLIYAALRSHV